MEDNREYRVVIIDSANAIFNDSNIYSFYVNLMQPLRDVYKIKILHAAVSIVNSNMGPGHPINNLDPIYIDLNNYNRTTGAINTANGINYVSYYDSIIIDTNKIYPAAIASDYTTMFNNFNENEGAYMINPIEPQFSRININLYDKTNTLFTKTLISRCLIKICVYYNTKKITRF